MLMNVEVMVLKSSKTLARGLLTY